MTDTIVLNDFYEDQDYNKTFQLNDSAGTPINITGYSFAFKARLPEAGTNAISKAMTLTTPASGLFSLALDSSDTNLLSGRVYSYQIQGSTGAGEKGVYVVGEFEVKKTF